MSYSKIDICNIALALLGADSIRSFDEGNKRSRMCDVFYNLTRDYLLSKFDWPFARSCVLLAELDETSVDNYIPSGFSAYQLPNNCKTPRDVDPPGSKDSWYIMANVLFTDKTGDIYLHYTKQEVNSALFSDTFSNLVALGIAVRLAPVISQDKALVKVLYDQYRVEQLEAWESDANIGEDYRTHDEDPNNDTFVEPDGYVDPDDESRFLPV